MKEIPVILTIAEGRVGLVEQTLRTLYANTKYPHKFYVQGSNIGAHQHVQIRNTIIKSLKDYEYVVSIDDDLWFREGWLENLVETHRRHPDIWVLGACRISKHTVIEERDDVVLTSRFMGCCTSFSPEVFRKYDKLPVRRLWDKGLAEKMGGKRIAQLKDRTWAVHCGITRHDGKRYSGEWVDDNKKLAKELGFLVA